MSAQMIFERAPIGAIIAWSDGTPRPPEHCDQHAAWRRNNGFGRLVIKTSRPVMGQIRMPVSFKVRVEGAGDSNDDPIVRTFPIRSTFRFRIVERPPVGSVRILKCVGEALELVHLASTRDHADTWLRNLGFGRMVLEEVTADEVGTDVVEGRAA